MLNVEVSCSAGRQYDRTITIALNVCLFFYFPFFSLSIPPSLLLFCVFSFLPYSFSATLFRDFSFSSHIPIFLFNQKPEGELPVQIFIGTTPEPKSNLAPSVSVELDITQYSSLLKEIGGFPPHL